MKVYTIQKQAIAGNGLAEKLDFAGKSMLYFFECSALPVPPHAKPSASGI